MATSPVTEEVVVDIELSTPSELGFSKDHCQETTPEDDHRNLNETPHTLARPKKVLGIDKNKFWKGKGNKLSKRKLFQGQSIVSNSGSESVSGSAEKRKKSEGIVENSPTFTKNAASCPVKLPLTERQQLAFLLEVTSKQTSFECVEDSSGKELFTKVKSRKSKKGKISVVNPRVYRRNERGETPLHIAAIKGDVAGINKLIAEGADVGVKDYAGWTALHEACNHGNLAAAKVILEHGAAVNVPGFEGDTPLHDAVVNNHVEVVDMLLSFSANPHQSNTKGKTPADLVNTKEMIHVFSTHGVHLPMGHNIDNLSDRTGTSESTLDNEVQEKKNAGNQSDGHSVPAESSDGTKLEGQGEYHNKGSILGNEIQRKQTQGESKMEKPVMYICKLAPRNSSDEISVRTTQVTQTSSEDAGESCEMPETPECDEGAGSDTVHAPSSEAESFTIAHEEQEIPLVENRSLGLPSESCQDVSHVDGSSEEILDNQDVAEQSIPRTDSVFDHLPKESSSPDTEITSEVTERRKESDAEHGSDVLSNLSSQMILHLDQEDITPTEVNRGEKFKENEGDKNESGIQLGSRERKMSTDELSLLENVEIVMRQGISLPRTVPPFDDISDRRSDVLSSIAGETNESNTLSHILCDQGEVSTKPPVTSKPAEQGSSTTGSQMLAIEKVSTKQLDQENSIRDEPTSKDNLNQSESYQMDYSQKSGSVSTDVGFQNGTTDERSFPNRSLAPLNPRRPPVTWRSLMARNRCDLTELRIPDYDQFLINTKDYELATEGSNASLQQTTRTIPLGEYKDKAELLREQKLEKEQLSKKQKSEKDKLQMSMEQEIVRSYAKNAYLSMKRRPPPGVCAAIYWQRMTPQQLKIEKKKLSQKCFPESNMVSQTSHQEIIDKYNKLKDLMSIRHKHEQQALDAVSRRKLQGS